VNPTFPWFIGFVPCVNYGIWRMAGGRFGHCMAFRQLDAERWHLVEANVWGIDVCTMDNGAIGSLKVFCIDNGTLLFLSSRRRPQYALPAPLITCASVTAALVGLAGWYFTPKQLYRGLRRAGAEVVGAHQPE
jgi:hypothetical protein